MKMYIRIYEYTCPCMLSCPHKVHMSYQHFLPTPLAPRVFHFTIKHGINLLQVIAQIIFEKSHLLCGNHIQLSTSSMHSTVQIVFVFFDKLGYLNCNIYNNPDNNSLIRSVYPKRQRARTAVILYLTG